MAFLFEERSYDISWTLPAPVFHRSLSPVKKTIPRYTVQGGYEVWSLDVLDTGRLAVAGYNKDKNCSFIDLFMLNVNADSQENPLNLTSEPHYSQEFTEFGLSWRSVCLVDDRLFLTCCKNTIALYDSSNGDLPKEGKLNDEASCIATVDGLVYVGLGTSRKVIVLDLKELKIKETISLTGDGGIESPFPHFGRLRNRQSVSHIECRDITVKNKKLFICTGVHGRVLMCNGEGEIKQEYKYKRYSNGWSITISEEEGLVFILWGDGDGSRQVVVYSLSRGRSSVSEGHSSIYGGHILVSYKVPDNSLRIRINNNINRLFVVTKTTGEVYEYHTSDIFFDIFLTSVELLVGQNDCKELRDYFGKITFPPFRSLESKDTESNTPLSYLVNHLRKEGKASFDDINDLKTACHVKGLSKFMAVLTLYQQAQDSKVLKKLEDKRQELSNKLTESKDRKQQLTGSLNKTEEEKQLLRDRLETTKHNLKTLNSKKEELRQQQKEELAEAKSSLRATKDELVKSQLEYAKQSMVMQEVLKQTREALNQQELASSASATNESIIFEERKTLDTSTLAADYARLMFNVAEHLTLDSTLKLAYLIGLPPAETDMLRRVSLVETPGITLINFMKTRNIINMYDVTNLQKGLVHIQLHQTNENLLAPYQSKVDPVQFAENQSPELLDWPVETVKFDVEETPSKGSDERKKNRDHSKESLMENKEREELPKQRSDSRILEMRHHHSYIEHRIKYEGGTISIMGVHLTIPEGALSCDSVIAVKVIYDPTIPLPGSARRGRMTPLIKLEPEELALKKPALLTIPHSAIIPEPDRHDVIIFTGLKENLQEGEITWTEQKSFDWKLDREKISFDINTLNYVFVNLVSQETEQKHIFRVVPFIDVILDATDGVLITVCFCKDSDEEYKLLLEDYHSKLCLGNYTTFQITRALNDVRDNASYIDLIMSSPGDGYQLTKEESTKHVDTDHLCAANRVSHQFRLKKNKDGKTDIVDVELKVSQHETNQTVLILQLKTKDILLSPKSQYILHPGLSKYEKFTEDIAKLLDKQHCAKLSMFFELNPVENETIQTATESGEMLMKILDEQELIMPDRMIRLYEGLEAIDFNKAASLVLEYIDTSKEKNGKEIEGAQDGKKMVKIPEKQEVISKEESTLSVNFKLLIEEGYKRLDVQRALKLSHGKLDLGRRLLSLAKEEHERPSLFPGSNLHKEQYFDQRGGEMFIAGVVLQVPAGALHTGRIVSMWVSTEPSINGPCSKKNLRLAPFVKFGPESLTLHKPVTVIVPHCAFTPADQMGLDVYSSVLQADKIIKWRKERKYISCSMNSQHFAVEAEKPCLIGLHVPFIPKMLKRVCVLPILNRVSESGDRLKIHLWFYNDDSLERKSLINEEIYQQKGSIIHDPLSVVLSSMTSTLHVSTDSSTSQCNPRKVDVAMEPLWLKNRYKLEFHLQNKGIKDTVSLDIEARYGKLRRNLFQLSIQLQTEKLRHIDQIKSPFKLILSESIIKSFDQLKQNLSEHLNVEQSTLLANIFQLPEEGITDIIKHKTPGTLLLDMLTKNSLISPTNITNLENALTEQGNEECAKLVRDCRWENPVLQATMCLD